MKRNASGARRVGALFVASLAVWSCQEVTSPDLELTPAFEISDARSGGNEHFYFLPPILPELEHTGAFDASLQPLVTISALGEPDIVLDAAVDEPSELYQVNWHTNDYVLDADKTYRITVSANDVDLGFADVDVVSSGSGLKNVQTGSYIGLKDGRTLPIKFRIEEGWNPTLSWRVLAPVNSGPQSLPANGTNGSTAIYLPDEDALVVVRRTGDGQPGELWRFSLATHQWTQLAATDWPIGKYREYVLDPNRNEIVVSWDGVGEIWSIPTSGGAWTLKAAAPNWQSHYTGTFFFDRGRDRLSHLFGYGLSTYRTDFLEYVGGWQSSQPGGDPVWTRIPYCSVAAMDATGSALYMSGGYGDANPAQQDPEPVYDDLIRFDVLTREFTILMPREHVGGVSRFCSAVAVAGGDIYRWGGEIFDTDNDRDFAATLTDELQRFDGGAWVTLETENNPPGAWHRAFMIYDAMRGDLVVIGGFTGPEYEFAVHAISVD